MKSALLILTAGALWGVISVFIGMLSDLAFSALQIVAVRCLLAVILLALWMVLRDRKLFRIDWRDLPVFFGTGVVSIVCFNYCLTRCLFLCGGAAVPTLLLYTAPAFVLLLSALFYKEAITKRKLLCLGMTGLGLCFLTGVFSASPDISGPAILFGVASGFGYALYSIFGKLVVKKYDPITVNFYTFLLAALVSVPLSGLLPQMEKLVDARAMTAGLCMAVLCTVLPYLLYNLGLRDTDAGRASVIATVEPLVATVVSAVYYQERFSLSKILGIILILAAVTLLNLSDVQRQKGKPGCKSANERI